MNFAAKVSEWQDKGAAALALVDLKGNAGLYPKAGNVLRLWFDVAKKDPLVAGGKTMVTLKVTSMHDIGPAALVLCMAAHPDLFPKADHDQFFYAPLSSPPKVDDEIEVEVTF